LSLIGTLQEIVRDELKGLRVAELGVVDAVQPHAAGGDSDNYACDVKLKSCGLLLRRVPIATGRIGSGAAPNVGDLVLLAFDQGDVNQPIVIGRLYDERQRAPLNHLDELIFRLPLDEADEKTIKAAIRRTDADPKRELIFEMPPKITVRVTDGTVRATAGKTEITLDQSGGGDGKVTVLAGRTKITMDQDGDVTVEAAGDLTIEATNALTLKGRSVSLQAQTSAEVKAGTQATLKGNAGATLDGGAGATVQGAMISIKGNASFTP
jgi:uncharacterized protein involved in type VI secretion and phage assembly